MIFILEQGQTTVETTQPATWADHLLQPYYALDNSWHVLGLGYNPSVRRIDIAKAALIHYNGNMKPWLEIGISKYKQYWTKYVKYDHIFLQQCNLGK